MPGPLGISLSEGACVWLITYAAMLAVVLLAPFGQLGCSLGYGLSWACDQLPALSPLLLQVVNVTGNQDICYYNFLCAHPLGNLRWGLCWGRSCSRARRPDQGWGLYECLPSQGKRPWCEAWCRPLLAPSTTSSATWGTSCWGCSSCSSSCSGKSTTTGPCCAMTSTPW